MTVPRKMVNRYQAAGVRPSGTGMTQPDKATAIVSTALTSLPCFDEVDIANTPKVNIF